MIFYDRKAHEPIFKSNKELIKCLICGKYLKSLNQSHVRRIHQITDREYKKMFNIKFTDPLVCDETKNRLHDLIYENISEEIRTEARLKAKTKRPTYFEFNRASHDALRKFKKEQHQKNVARIIELIKSKHDTLQRRLRKQDFTYQEYRSIFAILGTLKKACKFAGLPDYSDTRCYQTKSEEHKRNVEKQWRINNKERLLEYQRNYQAARSWTNKQNQD